MCAEECTYLACAVTGDEMNQHLDGQVEEHVEEEVVDGERVEGDGVEDL